MKITRALISVSDKTGVVEFARILEAAEIEIISTGGTFEAIKKAGIKVKDISEHTGFPEMMDGRVKTLHPKVHGGLLAVRDDEKHKAAMSAHDISAIDLVVVNLYPFEETVMKGSEYQVCVENIDIGGPSMIRSAAKNHNYVTVLVDPSDYNEVAEEITKSGNTSLATRKRLAAKAFSKTAAYDSAIATWFNKELAEDFPKQFSISGNLLQTLRYGENPHQKAAFYALNNGIGIAHCKQLQGKELSYNNINDADAALLLVKEFKEPAAVIVKHANPCGVAIAETIHDAYVKAYSCDTLSAFGGIIALNRPVNKQTAEEIAKIFVEVVIAPSFDDEAKEVLSAKKNTRLLEISDKFFDSHLPQMNIKSVSGGFLVQEEDIGKISESEIKVVSKAKPNKQTMQDLIFAFKVVKHVKSNAIVVAKDGMAIGIGAGQMSRVKSTMIACEKAVAGAVIASDAFLPFPDNVEIAAKAGIAAIIQPGGSVKDDEVIAEADKNGIAMVLTGIRHFKH